MKNIIAFVLMGIFGGMAHAGSSNNFAVVESSFSVSTLSISSFTATNTTTSGGYIQGRQFLVFQDLDSSNNIYCSNTVITSTSTNVFMVPKSGTPITMPVSTWSDVQKKSMIFYCLTEKTTGPSTLSLVQGY